MIINTNKKEVIAFTTNVLPLQTVKLIERVKGAGKVSGMIARFYPGQQRALRVTPYVNHKGNKQESLVTFSEFGEVASSPYIAGDDDRESFDCSVVVENDDEIVIKAINTDLNWAYDLVVYVTIEYVSESAI